MRERNLKKKITKKNNQIKKEYHVGVIMLIHARSAHAITLPIVMEIVGGVMEVAWIKVPKLTLW